ncbi:MAG TPA: DNA-directed RNA polymerase subunit omega [Nitrospiraceae bacterium]|nr:DNA-directed RNA polymerase subunit omega [Nitrospiraceae bacterium]
MSDMLQLLPENIQDRFDSRHRLVLVAAQRAKHLMQGAKPLGPARFAKETTQALDEVLQGQIQYLRGKEARDAIKESRKGRDLENERMAMMTAEDAREIKKELSNYVDDSPKEAAQADSEGAG